MAVISYFISGVTETVMKGIQDRFADGGAIAKIPIYWCPEMYSDAAVRGEYWWYWPIHVEKEPSVEMCEHGYLVAVVTA
jgi:hypothetical protein